MMAALSHLQAGCEGDGGAGRRELPRSPRCLPVLCLIFWEMWVALPPLCPEQPWFMKSSGGEKRVPHGTLLETLQWGSRKSSALAVLGMSSPLVSPNRPMCFPHDFLKPIPS